MVMKSTKNIQQLTQGEYGLKEATLYTAFKRLEQAGLIASYWGDDGPGARRRYYAITPVGRTQLERRREEWKQFRDGVDEIMKEDEQHGQTYLFG